MIGYYDDDTHFCLKCHSTILGLDNYVSHRKAGCSKNLEENPKSPLPSQLLPPDESFGLKADDFFYSLELQSSSKKTPGQSTSGKNFSGILTRSKATAVFQSNSSVVKDANEIQQSKSGKNVWIGGDQLKELGYGDNQTKLIKAVDDLERRKEEPARLQVYEESEEDSEEYDYDDESSDEDQDVPPRHFTGGKWKPSSPIQWSRDSRDWNVPPPSFTGGKWKPSTKRSLSPPVIQTKGAKWKPYSNQKEECDVPPPTFTGSKWVSKKQYEQDAPTTATRDRWKPRTDIDEDVPPPNHTKGKWKPKYQMEEEIEKAKAKWKPRGELEGDYPPPTHTKGKWKPKNDAEDDVPSPSYTKGKWKPKNDTEDDVPSPGYTKGKWKPKTDAEEDVPSPGYTKGKWKPKNDAEGDVPDLTKSKWKRNDTEDDVPSPSDSTGKWKPKCFGEDDVPPPGHTKGKWKPRNETEEDYPPPSHTKGKWKPKNDEEVDSPQPSTSKLKVTMKLNPVKETKKASLTRTAGSKEKWLPSSQSKSILKMSGESPLRKSDGSIQYWCNPCSRSLASKVVYERHLKSELHFKRTLHDREFDDHDDLNARRTKIKPPEPIFSNQDKKVATTVKKRNRKKVYIRCDVCHSKVGKYLIGKHLISHYHCRKGDITTAVAREMVLENIYGVVLECPFQCSVCRFYCNTHDDFLRHWLSEEHVSNNAPGYFFCSLCKFRSEDTELMYTHLVSQEHNEVVSVINRSVPIVIKKINPIHCLTCNKEFTLNMQLLNHCRKFNHDDTVVRNFINEYICQSCGTGFLSNVALQRHRQNIHKDKYFVCTPCNLRFDNSKEAKLHRRSLEHKYFSLSKSEQGKGSMSRKCEYCQESFANFLLLKQHLKTKHPEHKIRCPHCGTAFTITQELTLHLRSKSCKLEENPENAYRCEKCLFSSNSTSELFFHLALHDEPLLSYLDDNNGEGTSKSKPVHKYKCPLCDRFFPKSSLQAHIRVHTQERPFVCKICNAKFARKNNLQFHVKNHDKKGAKKIVKEVSGERPFLCLTCGASFRKKSILQQHTQIHTGKLCKCPKLGCIYTARKMSEIHQHFKAHSDVKNFSCTICEYKGKTKQQLNRHVTVHDEAKKYQCPQCPFTTRTSTHLRRHARIHTGAKPFSCPYCTYKCNNIENLRKHVLSTNKHPGKCIYECKFCPQDPFQGNFAKDFKTHLMTSHPEMFGNGTEAATYVAGIYELQDDNTYLDEVEDDGSIHGESSKIDDANEDMLNLKTNEDPVVSTSSSGNPSKNRALDQMLPMFIIPKEEAVIVENSPEAWNLIGRYDVEEESGTLIPFQSDGVGLFQDHFD